MLLGRRKKTHTPLRPSLVPSVAITRFMTLLEREGTTPVRASSSVARFIQVRSLDKIFVYKRVFSAYQKQVFQHLGNRREWPSCLEPRTTGQTDPTATEMRQRSLQCSHVQYPPERRGFDAMFLTWSPSSMKSSTAALSKPTLLATSSSMYLCRASRRLRCWSRIALARACTCQTTHAYTAHLRKNKKWISYVASPPVVS